MGLSFRRSIKLGKNVKLNLSKSGPSLSFGPKGAKANINKRGYRTTLSKNGIQYRKDYHWNRSVKQNKKYKSSNIIAVKDMIPYPKIFKILTVLVAVFIITTFINPLNIILVLIISIILSLIAIFNKQIRASNHQCYAIKYYNVGNFNECIKHCEKSLKYMEYKSTRNLMKEAQEQLNK